MERLRKVGWCGMGATSATQAGDGDGGKLSLVLVKTEIDGASIDQLLVSATTTTAQITKVAKIRWYTQKDLEGSDRTAQRNISMHCVKDRHVQTRRLRPFPENTSMTFAFIIRQHLSGYSIDTMIL